jgi:hypothetical protein
MQRDFYDYYWLIINPLNQGKNYYICCILNAYWSYLIILMVREYSGPSVQFDYLLICNFKSWFQIAILKNLPCFVTFRYIKLFKPSDF